MQQTVHTTKKNIAQFIVVEILIDFIDRFLKHPQPSMPPIIIANVFLVLITDKNFLVNRLSNR